MHPHWVLGTYCLVGDGMNLLYEIRSNRDVIRKWKGRAFKDLGTKHKGLGKLMEDLHKQKGVIWLGVWPGTG